jgi:hypothetical protein
VLEERFERLHLSGVFNKTAKEVFELTHWKRTLLWEPLRVVQFLLDLSFGGFHPLDPLLPRPFAGHGGILRLCVVSVTVLRIALPQMAQLTAAQFIAQLERVESEVKRLDRHMTLSESITIECDVAEHDCSKSFWAGCGLVPLSVLFCLNDKSWKFVVRQGT